MTRALNRLVAAELGRPAAAAVAAFARNLVDTYGGSVLGILFYGSCRRHFDPEGLLDFYVIYDRPGRFHRSRIQGMANALLPPNVMMATFGDLRAKVATLSLAQFARAMRPESADTTMWARFSQPSSLVWARDAAARDAIERCIVAAAITASGWARRFAPSGSNSRDTWQTLFAHTYAAELRPEAANRPAEVYEANPEWFDAVLGAAPVISPCGSWTVRRMGGRALNILRLSKAAFTFAGGADYIAWKLGRHAGVRLELTDRQRRHPLRSAPAILWRLYRRGVFNKRPAAGSVAGR